jgi:uncharacterized protein (TIRG00374 family)
MSVVVKQMDIETLNPKNSRWRLIFTIAAFVAFIALIYGLRHQIAEVIRDFGQINAIALLLIIPLKLINYDSYTRLYRNLFKTLDSEVKYWPMYKIALELNFVNSILPSGGVSGVSYFGLRMRSQGISAAKATLTQVMKFLLLFISFQPLLVLGVLLLAARGHTNNFIMVVASSLITLLIVGTLLGVYIIDSRSRINTFLTLLTKVLNKVIHLVRPNQPETINVRGAQKAFIELHEDYQVFKKNLGGLKWPLFHTTVANLCEIAALYVVYIAFGELVNFGAVILAYAVANFAGLISVLPAGIGIYEGLMTAVLAATGIPASLSIPVTIMFRVVTMFIQLPPGYYFYQKAVKSGLSTRT